MISLKSISKDRRNELNSGLHETKNLMESLSVDFRSLISNCIPSISKTDLCEIENKKNDGIIAKMKGIGLILLNELGENEIDTLKTHSSDSLRGLACYMVSHCEHLNLIEKLEKIKPLADDPHFGVREWAWLALRPDISKDIHLSLSLFEEWCHSDSAFLRRFACEATRPRGVWCSHIYELRKEPHLAHSLLDKLKLDTHLYVQKSLGNWLNDASKDHPDWVLNLLESWKKDDEETVDKKVIKLATRTIYKTKSKQ